MYPITLLAWNLPIRCKRPAQRRTSQHSLTTSTRSTNSTLRTSLKLFRNTNVTMTENPKLSRSCPRLNISTLTTPHSRPQPHFNLSIGSGHTISPNSYRIPTTSFGKSVLTSHGAFIESALESSSTG